MIEQDNNSRVLTGKTLDLLHKCHLGISKTIEHAKMSVLWSGITIDIKNFLSTCRPCPLSSDRQQVETTISIATLCPWSKLSLDNFEYQGFHYLMVLDVCSKYFIVRCVDSLNTEKTIQTLTSIFSEQGLPNELQCDRGRNFISDSFTQFCQHSGIKITYSSAHHHSSNPAERAIHTVKMLMKRCIAARTSWRLALLEYLSTPLDGNIPSPSGPMERRFKCTLLQSIILIRGIQIY